MFKLTPSPNRILVQQIKENQKESKGGVSLPSTVDREPKTQGKVLAVGNNVQDVKKGMTVFYGKYAGETIKVMEKDTEVEYVLLNMKDGEDEVLGWLD